MLHLDFILDGRERRITLRPGTQVLGRAGTSDLLVSHPSVSSQHISLTLLEDHTVLVKDLMSRNGLVVNDAKVPEALIRHGDVLRLGKVRLQLFNDDLAGDADHVRDTLIMEGAPAHNDSHSTAYRPATIPLLAPGAEADNANDTDDDQTPPAGTFLPEVINQTPQGVQVILPQEYSQEALDTQQQKKKKIIYGIAAAILVVAGIIIALPPPPPSKPTQRHVVKTKADYNSLLYNGMAHFKSERYVEAEKCWLEAQAIWKELNPKKDDDRITRVFLRLVKAYKDAQATDSWESLQWLELSQEARELDDRMVLDDDVASFIDSNHQKAVIEFAAIKRLKEARQAIQEGRFLDVSAITNQISPASRFSAVGVQLAQKAAEEEFDNSKEEILLMGNGGQFTRAIERAKELLKQRADQSLTDAVGKWQQRLQDQGILQEAERLTRQNDTQNLSEALRVLRQIGEESPDYAQASNMITGIQERLFLADVEAKYQASDMAGLKDLQIRFPEKANNTQLTLAIRNLEVIQNLFDDAEKLIAAKRYFDARIKWSQVQTLAKTPENHFHQQAALKLSEWSLPKIARIYIKIGDEAFQKKQNRQAREAYLVAQNQCKADVNKELAALRTEAKSLYDMGRNELINNQLVSGTMHLEQALECIGPDDPMYANIESRLKQAKK